MIIQSFAEEGGILINGRVFTASLMLLMVILSSLTSFVEALLTQGDHGVISCRVPLLAYHKRTGEGIVVETEIRISRRKLGVVLSVEANRGMVSEDTLESFKLAALYASTLLNTSPLDYTFSLRVDSQVEGLSATLGFFTTLLVMLRTGSCKPNYTGTGLIIPGGIVGPVGKLEEKIKAASGANLDTVYVPRLQLGQLGEVPEFVEGVYTVLEVYEKVLNTSLEQASIDPLVAYSYHGYFVEAYFDMLNSTRRLLDVLEEINWTDTRLTTSLRLLERAEKAYNASKYYVAASRAYGAFVSALASYLAYLANSKPEVFSSTVSTMLDEVNKTLDYAQVKLHELANYAFYSNGKNDTSVILVDVELLDVLVNAYTRLIESMYFINILSSTNITLDVFISAVAQSYARAKTVRAWLSVAEKLIETRRIVGLLEETTPVSLPPELGILIETSARYLNYMLQKPQNLVIMGEQGLEAYEFISELSSILFTVGMIYRSNIYPEWSLNVTLDDVAEIRRSLLKLINLLYNESGKVAIYPVLLLELVDDHLEFQEEDVQSALVHLFTAFTHVFMYLFIHRFPVLSASRQSSQVALEVAFRGWTSEALLIAVVMLIAGVIITVLSFRRTRVTSFSHSRTVFESS
ncbi:MAG: S16 family serine protease [Desulfurococcaceae archaeon]